MSTISSNDNCLDSLEHRQVQIYSWIIEFAAYKGWDNIVDHILESYPNISLDEVIIARINLNLARNYARFHDKLVLF